MKKLFLGICAAAMVLGSASEAAASVVPDDWVGSWFVHAGGLKVHANGKVSMTYQTYYERDGGLPTFPEIRMRVKSASGKKLVGRVVAQRQSRVAVGARFTMIQKAPGVRVRFSGSRKVFRFCDRWHQERGDCGA